MAPADLMLRATSYRGAISALEQAIQVDVGRDIGLVAEACVGGLRSAADSIVQAETPRVAIITGAFIPWAQPPASETDGPPGSALLAEGLKELGIDTWLVTDSLCAPPVRAVSALAELPVVIVDTPQDIALALAQFKRATITHCVSVERLGPGSDGQVRNMRGDCITAFTPPLDTLFTGGDWRKVAIGDGGNELGMGRVPTAVVEASVEHGARIQSVVSCDDLIVSSVSNWGAVALLASLRLLLSDVALDAEATIARHDVLLADCLGAGAVDGMTGRPGYSVDGLDVPVHHEVFRRLGDISDRGISVAPST